MATKQKTEAASEQPDITHSGNNSSFLKEKEDGTRVLSSYLEGDEKIVDKELTDAESGDPDRNQDADEVDATKADDDKKVLTGNA